MPLNIFQYTTASALFVVGILESTGLTGKALGMHWGHLGDALGTQRRYIGDTLGTHFGHLGDATRRLFSLVVVVSSSHKSYEMGWYQPKFKIDILEITVQLINSFSSDTKIIFVDLLDSVFYFQWLPT